MIKTYINNTVGNIIIDDFSNKTNDNEDIKCNSIYNFVNKNKSLQGELGIRTLTLPLENDVDSDEVELNYQSLNLNYFNKVMYFKQFFPTSGDTTHRLLVHGEDKKLYIYQMFYNLNMLNWTYQLTFNNTPIVLAYKKNGLDSILISSSDKLVVWSTNQTPYQLSNIPTITSMCVYNDILYCTIEDDANKIWYTSSHNPESIGTETDVTKSILLNDETGACRKIVTFKENLYVFRDYGISRLNPYNETPIYNQIYSSDSKIYSNTVTVCGDCIMFMTKDGVYKFNGTSVSKINTVLNNYLADINEYAVATNLQDKYYLALRVNFNDGKQILCESETDYKNNALIVLDLQDNSVKIMRGVDIKDMLALKAEFVEKIIVTFNSKDKDKIGEITNDGKYFNQELPKFYSSNYIIQDVNNVTIRKIVVEADSGVDIQIVTDEEVYTFTTYTSGVNEFQSIIPCKKFQIQIASTAHTPYVNFIQLEYEKRK